MADQLTASAGPPGPSPEIIRQHLRQVLSSGPFANAPRSARFLSYIVEEALAGRTDGIKELVLGTEVFGRTTDFDPRIDPVVRVEAGKLRKRLDDYYQSEGVTAPLRIEVPKGSYVPQFKPAKEASAPKLRGYGVLHSKTYAAAALALLLIAAGLWRGRPQFQGRPEPSIAVLPFLNISSDPSNEYLADGMAEELTDALCRAGGTRVAARTSSFFFKGKEADVHDIGSKLHVGFIVEGSVRRQGERLRVTVQLIRTDDGYHVGSWSLDRQLQDVLLVQQEIAAAVVSGLQVKLTGMQDRRLKKVHTVNQQAFDLYLRGKHALNTGMPLDVGAASSFFQQSIKADSAYALPYVALADLYMMSGWGRRPSHEIISQTREAVHRALELDNELAEGHAILGSLSARHEYDWTAAEQHLRHALELNPNSAFARNELAQNVLAPQGRWQEALTENRRALELDPLSPAIAVGQPWLAYLERHTDEALAGFRRLVAAAPADPAALGGLGTVLGTKGDYNGAIAAFQQVQRLGLSPLTLAFIGYVHGRAGRTAEARKIVEELRLESARQFVSPECFAVVYIGLAQGDEVFRYLEMAREQHSSFLIFARVDPFFDPIRSDARFATLLRELRLSDEFIQKNQIVTSGDYR